MLRGVFWVSVEHSERESLGREKRDSEEVYRLNFVTLGGGRPWNEETEEPLFPVIFLGRAASKMAQLFYWRSAQIT